jgi:glycerol-3-phosphate dehydrogenase
LLINAAGPWIDSINRDLGHSTRFIGGTKGSHLVLEHKDLRQAIGDHEFFFENNDGRIVLIFPLYDRVLIGTSDLPAENPDEARCTDDEIDYFLGMIGRVFPGIEIQREQIVFRFSGIRPLAYSGAKLAMGGVAAKAGQITRDHSLQVISGEWTGLRFPVYSLVGGKWTSFRAFSEQVTDKALAHLGRTRLKDTRSLQIGGGRGYPRSVDDLIHQAESLSAWTGLPRERLQILFERYGMRAQAAADFIRREPDEALKSLPDYSRREIAFLAQHEKIVHLDDFVLRRSMLGMLGRLNSERVAELNVALGDALGWDGARKKAEAARLLSILADRHGVRL